MIEVYIDGSGPPQNFYCVYIKETNKIITVPVEWELNKLSNNVAEYMAMIHALEMFKGQKDVVIYSDSKLVVNQLLPEDDPNSFVCRKIHLKNLNAKCKTLMMNYENLKITWIPRSQNLAGKVIERKIARSKGK